MAARRALFVPEEMEENEELLKKNVEEVDSGGTTSTGKEAKELPRT